MRRLLIVDDQRDKVKQDCSMVCGVVPEVNRRVIALQDQYFSQTPFWLRRMPYQYTFLNHNIMHIKPSFTDKCRPALS